MYNNSSGFANHSIQPARLVSPDFWVAHYVRTENRLSFKAIKCSGRMIFFFSLDKFSVRFEFHVRFKRFIRMWQFSQLERECLEMSWCFHFFCFYNCVDPLASLNGLQKLSRPHGALVLQTCLDSRIFPFYTLLHSTWLWLWQGEKKTFHAQWNMLFS